ncbi:ribosomal L7Ae/L30e/S12e/Gadd45 family protein [Candidatus Woesearchaeota archaeon]|nr:ribosomal L7Ae/L30e/S12e/Gadd45 family protein [Candidatus Woesearchaeota archaeon]
MVNNKEDNIEEIKKNIKSEQLVIGAAQVERALRSKKLTKVFLSKNCPPQTKEQLHKFAGLNAIEIVDLDIPSDELGVVCKKPFVISALGLVKGK